VPRTNSDKTVPSKGKPVKANLTEFKQRLITALDKSDVPPHGKGQQVVVSKALGVSQEAVRNWLLGKARPRPEVMEELAKLLEVDNSWLSLGQSASGSMAPVKAEVRTDLNAAVHYVVGLMGLAGKPPAFSDKPGTDLAVVSQGALAYYAVVPGTLTETGTCVADIPADIDETATVVIAMPDKNISRVALVLTNREEVEALAEYKNGFYSIEMDVESKPNRHIIRVGGHEMKVQYAL